MIQLVWAGAKEFACLTSSQVMLMLLSQDLSLSNHCSDPSRGLWRDQGPSRRIYSQPSELCTHSWSLQSCLPTLVITVSSTQASIDKGRTHLTGIRWVSGKMKRFVDPCGLTQLKFLCSCVLKTSVCFQTSDKMKVGLAGDGNKHWDEFV